MGVCKWWNVHLRRSECSFKACPLRVAASFPDVFAQNVFVECSSEGLCGVSVFVMSESRKTYFSENQGIVKLRGLRKREQFGMLWGHRSNSYDLVYDRLPLMTIQARCLTVFKRFVRILIVVSSGGFKKCTMQKCEREHPELSVKIPCSHMFTFHSCDCASDRSRWPQCFMLRSVLRIFRLQFRNSLEAEASTKQNAMCGGNV